MMSLALLGAGWVLWLLVALSIACVAVSVERWIYLSKSATDTKKLAEAVNSFLTLGNTTDFNTHLAKLDGMEARILHAGMEVAEHGPIAAEKAMNGTATAEKLLLERGLFILATVGSNAPFIGLFGTVLGIMQAFHDLSKDIAGASDAVMAGISEALVATAVGLLVAIPAVVLYNLFARQVKARLARSESVAQLVLARLEGDTHGR